MIKVIAEKNKCLLVSSTVMMDLLLKADCFVISQEWMMELLPDRKRGESKVG